MTYVVGKYSTYACLAACVIGILKKAGYPSYSAIQEWVQYAALAPETHTLTYLLATLMSPGGIFIDMPIMIACGTFLVDEIYNLGVKSGVPPFNFEYVQNLVKKGTTPEFKMNANLLSFDF